MTQKTLFIFGIANFALLIIALSWGLKGMARQFFFARNSMIKKEMIASAKILKEAKARFLKSAGLAANLEKEILERRSVAVKRSDHECAEIIKFAEMKALGLAQSAERQSEEAKNEAKSRVKLRLLDLAFDRAVPMLLSQLNEDAKKKTLERGLKEISAIIASQAGADLLRREIQ